MSAAIESAQIAQTFKKIAKANCVAPEVVQKISGHSTRVGSAQDLLTNGESLGQIMARVGWTKVDTVMRYVGLTPMQSLMQSTIIV